MVGYKDGIKQISIRWNKSDGVNRWLNGSMKWRERWDIHNDEEVGMGLERLKSLFPMGSLGKHKVAAQVM